MIARNTIATIPIQLTGRRNEFIFLSKESQSINSFKRAYDHCRNDLQQKKYNRELPKEGYAFKEGSSFIDVNYVKTPEGEFTFYKEKGEYYCHFRLNLLVDSI